MIRFSIIIPHKNIPDLLQRMLDSIPKRNDVQVIIVDDNSDPSIVDFEHFPGLNNPNTEVYFTKEGKGAGYARNVGLKHAKGEWLLFADADDMYITEKLNNFFNLSFPNDADVIIWGYIRLLLNGKEIRNYVSSDSNLFVEDISEHIYSGFWCVPWVKMVRKDIVISNKIYFEEVYYSNDVRFSVKLAIKVKRIYAYNQLLYLQIERKNSLVTNRTIHNSICRLNVGLMANKLLIKQNMKTIRLYRWLNDMAQYSYWYFLLYTIKSIVVVGYNNVVTDYKDVCNTNCFSANLLKHIFNILRVKISLKSRILK